MPNSTIIAFGNYDLDGARSWVIRTGLQESGYDVALCRTEVLGLFGKYRDLWKRWNSALQASQSPVVAIYVVFLGHYLMPLAWFLGKRAKTPVIFDALVSLYDTEVGDRKRVSRFSPYAWVLWMTDWIGFRLADVILADTEEHKEFFVKSFGVDPKKILVIPVGCRSDLFRPSSTSLGAGSRSSDQVFKIEFHGTYIPLQGTDIILTAARELQKRNENVQFTLVGTQMERALKPVADEWGLTNVRFHHSVPIIQLPQFIQDADACLGVFGATAKADRVIPNKAYEVIACGKPLITGNTMAARRVFTDRENVLLCRVGDAADLVDKILLLKNDAALRSKIAEGGLVLSKERLQPVNSVAALLEWLHRTH